MINSSRHYWMVRGLEDRRYSSAAGAFVPADDPAYLAWREQQVATLGGDPTSFAGSVPELVETLQRMGVQPGPEIAPPPSPPAYQAAAQAHVDATAAARGYDSGVSLASYVASTVPGWAAEAQAFVAWRDAIWGYALTELAKVQAGQRPAPTVEAFVTELPDIAWPG